MERIKKHFVQIFKDNGLLISVQCNMKSVNYLDVTLNLDRNSYQLYNKSEDVLTYVHVKSPTILKQIQHSIDLRLLATSSSESIFQNSTPMYKEALKNLLIARVLPTFLVYIGYPKIF